MPIGTSDGEHFEDAFSQEVERAKQASMTHQAEQPNPAAPIIDTASKFMHGGLSEAFPDVGFPKAGDVLHSDSANAALGMFGGAKAYTPFAKEFAEALEAQGTHPKLIKNWTGLERGAEGMWRKEISDVSARSDFDLAKMDKGTWRSGNTYHTSSVGEILQHDKFFKSYPEAKNIPVVVDPKLSSYGMYSGGEGIIRIKGGLSSEQQHSTLLHELQHWVQDKEGFHFDTPESIGRVYRPGDIPEDDFPMSRQEVYSKLATEVEARNVQKRAISSRIPPELARVSETDPLTLKHLPRTEQIVGAPREGRGYGQRPQ